MFSELEKQINFVELDIVGNLLTGGIEALNILRGNIEESDFEFETTKAVFRACCELEDENEPINASTIIAKAESFGTKIDTTWASSAMSLCCGSSTLIADVGVIKDYAIERATRDVAMKILGEEVAPDEALASLTRIVNGRIDKIRSPMDDANDFLKYYAKVVDGKVKPFTSTGYLSLDEKLGGGLVESGFITLAARPAMGKSLVGLAIADNVAMQGKKVLYESLEMSKTQLWARRIARKTGIFATKIIRGDIDKQKENGKIVSAISELSQRNFYIETKPATVSKIERDMRAIDDLGLVVIDHFGLIIPENANEKRYESATKASHRLKQLANATGIPILVLCQLSRAGVGDVNKKPAMDNLRDSGAIEEDSDVVMLLHRPDYYVDKDQQTRPWLEQELDVIIDKNRHGDTGEIKMNVRLAQMNLLER